MSWRAPFAALVLSAGCVTVAPASDSAVRPPLNTCHAQECAAYQQSGASPICNGGVCLAVSLYTDLVLVVSLSMDSYFAPGETFAIPFASLADSPSATGCPQGTTVPCSHLPAYGIVQGAYTVSPDQQVPAELDYYLGNPGLSTALPVHVTYRPLWPPAASPPSSALFGPDIDLPLDPIAAFVIVESAPGEPPGPGQGTSIGFQANLQPALYERTIQPDPPFDTVFPPDVQRVTITAGNQRDEERLTLDTTTAETQSGKPQIPTFNLSRVGGLAGWRTYLRDVTTLRPLSPIVTLGLRSTQVILPTNHHPAGGDALTNAELVIAPPVAAVAVPTYKVDVNAGVLSQAEAYPTLEAPVVVSGTVTDVDGATPVEADLFFEATAIYADTPGRTLNTANFDFTARTKATFDPTGTASTYSLPLPPGHYRVTARPADAVHQVTALPAFDVEPVTGATASQVTLDVLRPVQGYAIVADGRPMSGATVEAIPSTVPSYTSTVGMPRPADTVTAANGSFAMALDPGSYVLRVRPQDGTGFPWVTQPLLVGPTAVTVPAVVVPAPVDAGRRLLDPYDNPVVSALVRVYQVPASGQAVELARAYTDATGAYDLYLAPSAQ